MVGISYNSFATTNISHSPLYPADNTRLVGSLWTSTVSGIGLFALGATAPSTTPADGTLWYDSTIDEVDLLVHNGHTWVGLQFQGNGTTTFSSPYRGLTDAQGPIISASQPTARPDGQNAFVTGDLWIDTSGDLDMFPVIKRYNGISKQINEPVARHRNSLGYSVSYHSFSCVCVSCRAGGLNIQKRKCVREGGF
jgi:hypothetical protein